MKNPFGLLLQYSSLFALAISILFEIRCLALAKILKKEYQVDIKKMGAKKLASFQKEIAMKEIKYLLLQFIGARTWFKALLIATAIIFTLSYFL